MESFADFMLDAVLREVLGNPRPLFTKIGVKLLDLSIKIEGVNSDGAHGKEIA